MSTELVQVVQHLADLLAQENDALKRQDFSAAVALASAKEAALADLTKQPPRSPLPPPVAALGQRLGRLVAENQMLLERAIGVQTSIVRIVARACAPPPAAKQYGGHGGRKPSLRAAAMALSTRA
jgi:hypothetical protein